MSSCTVPPLVLAGDVVFTPVAELPPELLALCDACEGDFCVTRPGTRSMSVVVDPATAELLAHFREGKSLVDAIAEFASSRDADPHDLLDAAFPALVALSREGLLVPAASAAAEPIAASLTPGSRVAGMTVSAPVKILDDTEVYRAVTPEGRFIAIKMTGKVATSRACEAIQHEAAVLKYLGERRSAERAVTPSLLVTGAFEERPFLATTWHNGADLYQAGAEARAVAPVDGREELLKIAEAIVEAYAALHRRGVVHLDLHPRNVLVGPRGDVTLVDFGLAAVPDAGWTQLRGGVDLFQAPEIAHARRCGNPLPAASFAAELYGVAALVYFLLAGRHTHRFSLQSDEMLRQVVEDPILPLGDVRLEAVESCLSRALAKNPEDRYSSTDEFLCALRVASERDRSAAANCRAAVSGWLSISKRVVDRLRVPGELYASGLGAPTATVTYGAAGVAYALLRLSYCGSGARLLAEADAWAERAAADLKHDSGAVWNETLGIVPSVFGKCSLYHHAAGVHLVRAMIARARADDQALEAAIEEFVAASEGSGHLDVGFGRSGLLLGCSLLLELLPGHVRAVVVRELGDRHFDCIWSELEREPAIGEGTRFRLLGMAHGWAGFLYSLLRWCDAAGRPPTSKLRRRVNELAALAEPASRGYRWPREVGTPVDESVLTPSWCNGAAGHAHLFALAYRAWGDEHLDDLALGACWTAYSIAPDALGDLCCGLAGRAYALLARYRETGQREWLFRARSLAERAAAQPLVPALRRDSLYHGEPAIALLLTDTEGTEFAGMPLFELEGWFCDDAHGPPSSFAPSATPLPHRA